MGRSTPESRSSESRAVHPRFTPLLAPWASLALALALLLLAAGARGEELEEGGDVQACASAYEQAQVARNNGKLVDAQEHLRICVQESCPDFVKTDCGQWLSDIRRDIPSVIFAPVDFQGNEVVEGVKVTVDGTEVPLDGRPVELDPGQHEVSYEYEGKTQTEKVAIRQGEKNRVIKLEVVSDADSDADGVMDSTDQCPMEAGVAPSGCPAKVEPKTTAQPDKRLRLGAYIGWGVGGAGLIAGGIFGLLGNSAEQDAIDECSPDRCTQARIDELAEGVGNYDLMANVSFGVGIVGAAAGTVLFFMSQPSAEKANTNSALRMDVHPVQGGSLFSLSGAF